VAGGLIGHLWKGMSRKDLHEVGDDGETLIVVIGHDKMEHALLETGLKAQKHLEKQLDAEAEELEPQREAAEKELAAS
jgi:hypothetical protein